jgi:hypothetical protein
MTPHHHVAIGITIHGSTKIRRIGCASCADQVFGVDRIRVRMQTTKIGQWRPR